MKIAVTGAGGFLGTEILRQLSALANVVVYAFTFEYERERPTFVYAENIVEIDNDQIGDFDFSSIDVLLNCAFPRNVEDASFAAGLDFIQKVLLKASADNVKAVVNISSQSVYSQKRMHPAGEQEPIVLETKYAVGKYAMELLVNAVFKDVPHTNLRMASLIGAGFNQRITNKFAAKVIAGEQITITGGDQLFGFMDVRDAADGIITVLMNSGILLETYNFGLNESYTLKEIAQCVYAEGKKRGYTAPSIMVDEGGTWQNSSLVCNSFYKDFSWKPRYKLQDTVNAIYDNLKE